MTNQQIIDERVRESIDSTEKMLRNNGYPYDAGLVNSRADEAEMKAVVYLRNNRYMDYQEAGIRINDVKGRR